MFRSFHSRQFCSLHAVRLSIVMSNCWKDNTTSSTSSIFPSLLSSSYILQRRGLSFSTSFISKNVSSRKKASYNMDELAHLHLGDIRLPIYPSDFPERIPVSFARAESYFPTNTAETLAYFRWMAQKELLQQDMCLLGDPGPTRRWLALQYCAYAKREVQMLVLSRDTTEADIKQRKEISGRTLHYINQPAVTAALQGQVLVIEGLERAERNVLPVINNLLENREMHLDNGMMLIHPARYDTLVAEMGQETVDKVGLLRVSEGFRVIALAVPVPKYSGNPLDPPLRSRFQCMYVHSTGTDTLFAKLAPKSGGSKSPVAGAPQELLAAEEILKFKTVLSEMEKKGTDADKETNLPQLQDYDLLEWNRQHRLLPQEHLGNLLSRVYPWSLLCMDCRADEAERRQLYMASLLKRYHLNPAMTQLRLTELEGKEEEKIESSDEKMKKKKVAGQYATAVFTPISALGKDSKKPHSEYPLQVPVGGNPILLKDIPLHSQFSLYHWNLFHELAQSHAVGRHICLIGQSGCGKTNMIREYAAAFGYRVEVQHLYADMSTRDLLQRRTTDVKSGDTAWELSPLMKAALKGDLAVLDGVDNLAPHTLAVLQELLIDGSMTLYDGSRYISHTQYTQLKQSFQLSEEGGDAEMAKRGIFCVHPSFRVIATARFPTTEHNKKFFLTTDIVSLFNFHVMQMMEQTELEKLLLRVMQAEIATIQSSAHPRAISSADKTAVQQLVSLSLELDALHKQDSKVPRLSLRQLILISRYIVAYPMELYDSVSFAILLPLMSTVTATEVRRALDNTGISKHKNNHPRRKRSSSAGSTSSLLESAKMRFGFGSASSDATPPSDSSLLPLIQVFTTTSSNENDEKNGGNPTTKKVFFYQNEVVYSTERTYTATEKSLVPHVTNYFDNPLHSEIMAWLMKQIQLQNKVLLVGKQGVGKNKIVDRFLSLAGLPRHYIQLHRDTTVASLTINPTVVDGKVIWEDSPLVKAVQAGHVLVVDEIDKAPVEVVQILKGLIDDREMQLSDGRKISAWEKKNDDNNNIITLHPDFRMIVLANPPGFPFHGNDFYRECGDLFACYVVENPDAESKEHLLRRYAPHVPHSLLTQLIAVFSDLEECVREETLQYPFSLRELISVVKHLEAFPQDGIFQAMNNVFNFDLTDEHTMDTVRRVLHQRLRKNSSMMKNMLAKESPLEKVEGMVRLKLLPQKTDGENEGGNGLVRLPVTFTSFEATELIEMQPQYSQHEMKREAWEEQNTRKGEFTETKGSFALPFLSDADEEATTATTTEQKKKNVLSLTTVADSSIVVLAASKKISVSDGDHMNQHAGRSVLELISFANPVQDLNRPPCALTPGRVCTLSFPARYFSSPERNTLQMFRSSSLSSAQSVVLWDGSQGRDLWVVDVLRGRCTRNTLLTNTKGDGEEGNKFLKMVTNSSVNGVTLFVQQPQKGAERSAFSNTLRVLYYNKFMIITLPEKINDAFLTSENIFHLRLEKMGDVIVELSVVMAAAVEENTTGKDHDEFVQATLHLLRYETTSTEGNVSTEVGVRFVSSLPVTRGNTYPSSDDGKAAEHFNHVIVDVNERRSGETGSDMIYGSTRVVEMDTKDDGKAAEVRLQVDGYSSGLQASRSAPAFRAQKNTTGWDQSRHQIVRSLSPSDVQVINTKEGTSRTVTIGGGTNTMSSSSSSPSISLDQSTGNLMSYSPLTNTLSVVDTDTERLSQQYKQWTQVMSGGGGGLGAAPTPQELNMWYSQPRKKPSGTLKHGEEDSEPHVGGNTYAGGTGGTDTAGLGGIIGPYRLDKGHPVHQVDPALKKKVPKHIVEEARHMGKVALEQRLKEINMSTGDNERYMSCLARTQGSITQLQLMLKGLKAREGERLWVKHQTDGVWDDAKLVEGITGEKNIYKKRSDSQDPNSLTHKKKKRLLFVLDVSASMYRFNGMDQRLNRLVETTVMIMEAFIGHEDKISYSIVGHNGDSDHLPLVEFDKPPQNKKQRMDICLKMIAYSQFCWTGDHTVEAMRKSLKTVTAGPEADSYFVFVISDANLDQYNISPSELSRIIRADERVHMYCIFIASFGAQASYLQRRLPPGHGFECMDTARLPLVMKQIFVGTDLLGGN